MSILQFNKKLHYVFRCIFNLALIFFQELASQASYPQRNDEMKERITELLTTLEKVKRNSELRQQQSDELILDLKKNNR